MSDTEQQQQQHPLLRGKRPLEPELKPFCLFVRTLTGKNIAVELRPDALVYDLKNKIDEKEGIPPEEQRLVFCGQELEDGRLADYAIKNEATLHLILRLRGQGHWAYHLPGILLHQSLYMNRPRDFKEIYDRCGKLSGHFSKRQFVAHRPFLPPVTMVTETDGIQHREEVSSNDDLGTCIVQVDAPGIGIRLLRFDLRVDESEVSVVEQLKNEVRQSLNIHKNTPLTLFAHTSTFHSRIAVVDDFDLTRQSITQALCVSLGSYQISDVKRASNRFFGNGAISDQFTSSSSFDATVPYEKEHETLVSAKSFSFEPLLKSEADVSTSTVENAKCLPLKQKYFKISMDDVQKFKDAVNADMLSMNKNESECRKDFEFKIRHREAAAIPDSFENFRAFLRRTYEKKYPHLAKPLGVATGCASLTHRRTVTKIDDVPQYILRPRYETSLAELISKKKLTSDIALRVFRAIGKALLHLKEIDIVACAVKPENVLLNVKQNSRDVALCDFGFTETNAVLDDIRRKNFDAIEEEEKKEGLSEEEKQTLRIAKEHIQVLRYDTFAVAAPEVHVSGAYSHGSDIWDFGILCLQMYDALEGTELVSRLKQYSGGYSGNLDESALRRFFIDDAEQHKPRHEVSLMLAEAASKAMKFDQGGRELYCF